jgi:hypothetical protein
MSPEPHDLATKAALTHQRKAKLSQAGRLLGLSLRPLPLEDLGGSKGEEHPRILVKKPLASKVGSREKGGAAPCVVTLCEHARAARLYRGLRSGLRTFGTAQG